MANEAPERIWAVFEPHQSGKGHPVTYATAIQTKGTEYIRADLATLSSDAVAGGEEVDDEKPRYTTKRLRHEIARARENDARELDQLRDRVKELEKALEWLIEAADSASWAANIGTMDNAIEAARRVREGGKVE